MRRLACPRGLAGLILSVCWMSGVDARSVDYGGGASALIEVGQALKVSPLTIEPTPSFTLGAIKASSEVDHQTMALGNYCAAWKVDNPIGRLLPLIAEEWNKRASATQGPSLAVSLSSASSYRRCVEVGEMNVRCITRVKLAGTAELVGGSSGPVPISADEERDASVGGFCGNLAQGIGVVSREAVLALLADAEKKVQATTVSP